MNIARTPLLLLLVVAASPAADHGLNAEYFPDIFLAPSPGITRVDATIDFDWSMPSPGSPLGLPERFSARWAGDLVVPASGDWTFAITSDDGMAVFIDGHPAVVDWSDHPPRDVAATIALTAGPHPIDVLYYQRGGLARAQLRWSGPGTPEAVVPSSALLADRTTTRRSTLPDRSAISPACVETWHPPGPAATIARNGKAVAVDPLSDHAEFANVPLSASAPVTLAVTTADGTTSTPLTWTPTVVPAPGDLVVRAGDALLLEGAQKGTLRVTMGCGAPLDEWQAKPGKQKAFTFADPGLYTVALLAKDGSTLGATTVRAVAVDLSNPLACQVGYLRLWHAGAQPDDAFVGVGTADADTAWATGGGMGLIEAQVEPWRTTGGRIVLRAGAINGPILATKEIAGFTVDTTATVHALIDTDEVGFTPLTMRPWVPDVEFRLAMFAHRATFLGGDTALVFNSSGVSMHGKPDMRQEIDPATGETIGVRDIGLEVPLDEDSYCFSVTTFQEEGLGGGMAMAGAMAADAGGSGGSTQVGGSLGVNGHTCHVYGRNTLEFPITTGPKHDVWRGRKFTGCSGETDSNDCTYVVKIPFPDAPYTSDPKVCNNACENLTPVIDTGTVPGRYAKQFVGAGDCAGTRTTDGFVIVSRLWAEQPKQLCPFPIRKGRVFDPVIVIVSGGQDDALYGVVCHKTNTFVFKAKADEVLPEFKDKYKFRWTTGVGGTVVKDKASDTVEAEYPPGRYFPKLEVILADDASVVVGKAEIHSIAIENRESNNVPDGSVPLIGPFGTPMPDPWGAKFVIHNKADGTTVDSRVAIQPAGERGRVSLDGYPQTEYWYTDSDTKDLAQVVQVPDGKDVTAYAHPYGMTEATLKLTVDGQALIEQCDFDACANQLPDPDGRPVSPGWHRTDEDPWVVKQDAHCRESFAKLSYELRARTVMAFLATKAEGDYDQFVQSHWDQGNKMGPGPVAAIHMNANFLPWHRAFIAELEKQLQKRDPCVDLPYWNWPDDADVVFAKDAFGDKAKASPEVKDGPFAYRRGCWKCLAFAPDAPHVELYRGAPDPTDRLPTAAEVAHVMTLTPYDKDPWNRTPASFRNELEGWRPYGLHNMVHVWVGGADGQMGTMASPNDPVFFLHHARVDQIWSLWQTAHPTAKYLPQSGAPAPITNGPDKMPPILPGIEKTPNSQETAPCYK